MPRPQSDITGKQIQIAVRVTASQKEAFKQLGGAAWLRKQLTAELERRWQAEQPSLGKKIISRVFGR
jgi:hypothetical protein